MKKTKIWCSVIWGTMKWDNKFKYQTCAIKETCTVQECLGVQSLQVVETFCYLSKTIGARRSLTSKALWKIRSR